MPCLPSTGVPVPLRLTKNTRRKKKRGKMRDFLRPQAPVSGTRPPVPQGKTRDILCPHVLVPGTCSPVPPPCLPSSGVPVPLRIPKSTSQKKPLWFLSTRLEPGGGALVSRRAGACILPPSQGAGFLQVWMWSGCCPVSSGLYFRKIFLCYIFISLCVFGRRFPLLYSHLHPGSAPLIFFF